MAEQNLVQVISQKAHELGFDLVGITTPERPAHADQYLAWIQAGYQGEMGYMSTPRSQICRVNPKELFPECQSIIVLAMGYPNPARLNPKLKGLSSSTTSNFDFQRLDSSSTNLLSGKVAAYAWGKDYHQVLKKRLKILTQFIEEISEKPIQSRLFTDSAPILERDLAWRAGLGWIGKNTCLINPQIGSHSFLAEILLDLELPPSSPFATDYCGKCSRCIAACPSHCILPNRTIDARRCISYLTIELRSAIPIAYRPLIDQWLFGCDVCQEVCPWNQHTINERIDEDFQPQKDQFPINLIEILELNEEQFQNRFAESSLRRAKPRGLARNAAVILGNYAKEHPEEAGGTAQVLEQLLDSQFDPLVRQHILWSLEYIRQ